MAGCSQTYYCERCPLVIELGGSTRWDESLVVYLRMIQVACGACGTMHRVTEDRGECQVTAVAGPIRVVRTETLRNYWGDEIESAYWVTEEEWRPVGSFGGGVEEFARLPCNHCGKTDGMLRLDDGKLPYDLAMAGGREACPVCRGPMECIQVSDSI